jgi:hypothetical protein
VGPSVTVCYSDPHITSEEELVNECQFLVRKGRWGRCRRMIGGCFGERGISSRGLDIRNISYIQPKWENIIYSQNGRIYAIRIYLPIGIICEVFWIYLT